MRDIKRLDIFYDTLKSYHSQLPDWRFLQFMINFLEWHLIKYGTDGFYLEDDKCLEKLDEFMEDIFQRTTS